MSAKRRLPSVAAGMITCPWCEGSGSYPRFTRAVCGLCAGKGRVRADQAVPLRKDAPPDEPRAGGKKKG